MFCSGKIILASSSPRRLDLLKNLGIDVTVCRPEVMEMPDQGESPLEFTLRMAKDKARECLSRVSDDGDIWVIGADTTVVCQGNQLDKPADREDAKRMLKLLSGKTHKVITSFCVLDSKGKVEETRSVESFVTFRCMTDREIEWYVGSEEPMDKAGAYGAQGLGSAFIEKVDGSYTNVIGLPLCELLSVLIEVGAVSV